MVFTSHELKLDGSKKQFRTLAMICEDEYLSDAQLKSYQTRFQEYRTFLESMTRLASCGNVCITEEIVMVGENGLLNSESLNALQHAGAISVYNTIQQNNWEYPIPEDGEVAIVKNEFNQHDDSADEIKFEQPAIHISDCFIEGEKARLHGTVRSIKSYLPPTIYFKNAIDVNDEDNDEPDLQSFQPLNIDEGIEIIENSKGFFVKRDPKDKSQSSEAIPMEEYFYAVTQPSEEYCEEKAEYRFKCAVCQRMFTSNVHLMHHIIEHVDENSIALTCFRDDFFCMECQQDFSSAYELRLHNDRIHPTYIGSNGEPYQNRGGFDGDINAGNPNDIVPMIRSGCNSATAQYICKICGKECQSELSLAHHLQFTHYFQEQPYVCKLCMFKSSVYEDVLEHFYKFHQNSNHLICPYCLRVFTPSDARPAGWSPPQASLSGGVSTAGLGAGVGQTQVLLQHLRLHQVAHHVRRCTCCKLNFTNKSDYQIHLRLDHKATIPGEKKTLEDQQHARRHGITLITSQSNAAAESRQNKEATHLSLQDSNITLVDENGRQIVFQGGMVPPGHELAYLEGEDEGTLVLVHQDEIGADVVYQIAGSEEPPISIDALARAELKSQQNSGQTRKAAVAMMVQSETEEALLMPQMDEQVGFGGSERYEPTSPSADSRKRPYGNEIIRSYKPGPKSMRKHLSEDSSKVAVKSGIKKKKLLACLECDASLDDTNHKRRLPCSACGFATCCASAFNRHVERVHLRETSRTKLLISKDELRTGNPFTRAVNFKWMTRIEGDSPEEVEQMIAKGELPDVVYDPRKFYCMNCGRSGMEGNHLARHLAEECAATTATLNPTKELLELAVIISDNKPIPTSVTGSSVVITDTQRAENSTSLTAVAVQTLGVLQPGQTVELTNEQGEVFQQLSWPEGIQLDPGQIVVIIQGEDGAAQLAIVAEDTYDPATSQVLLPPDDENLANELQPSESY